MNGDPPKPTLSSTGTALEAGSDATPPKPALNNDPKSMLNCFCQKKIQRPISKQDIVYSVQKFGSQSQATVTLACIDGIQFAGEVATTSKQAEQNAAQIALAHYGSEVEAALAQKGGLKRKAGDAGLTSATEGTANAAAVANAKSELNTLLGRYLKKPLVKGDIVFETVMTALGFQSTCSLPCMSGESEYEGLGWAGEVASKKKQAEESAAFQCLEALSSDVKFLASAVKAPPKPFFKGKGFGKGKGKGKGKSGTFREGGLGGGSLGGGSGNITGTMGARMGG